MLDALLAYAAGERDTDAVRRTYSAWFLDVYEAWNPHGYELPNQHVATLHSVCTVLAEWPGAAWCVVECGTPTSAKKLRRFHTAHALLLWLCARAHAGKRA